MSAEYNYNFYFNDTISLSQVIEWETSKVGFVMSFVYRIPFFHTIWVNRIIKQYERYKRFNDALKLINQ